MFQPQKISVFRLYLLDIILSIAILVLETTNKSIVLLFAGSRSGILFPAFYNYCDLKPFGYGNIFPPVVFVFSIVLLLCSLLRLHPRKRAAKKTEQNLLRLSILFNLLPFLLFSDFCRISAGVIYVEIMLFAKYGIFLYAKNFSDPAMKRIEMLEEHDDRTQ